MSDIQQKAVMAGGVGVMAAVVWPNLSPVFYNVAQKLQNALQPHAPSITGFLTPNHLIGLSLGSLWFIRYEQNKDLSKLMNFCSKAVIGLEFYTMSLVGYSISNYFLAGVLAPHPVLLLMANLTCSLAASAVVGGWLKEVSEPYILKGADKLDGVLSFVFNSAEQIRKTLIGKER